MFLVMSKKTTEEAKIGQSFIFERNPKFFTLYVDYVTTPSKWFINGHIHTNSNKLSFSKSQDRLFDSIYLPNLLPSSLPTSFDMQSKGRPQTWTQNGEWVKVMVATDSPFLHLVRSRRLLSKFQGPFRSTHSIWYIELNLNCRTFCPTSTIRKSEPVFQADRSVLFRAHRFLCRSASNGPNKLNAHSSSRSDLLMVEMVMSSSSSLVSLRCWMPSKTAWSMTVKKFCELLGY